MKKLAFLLTISLLFGALPAFAEEEPEAFEAEVISAELTSEEKAVLEAAEDAEPPLLIAPAPPADSGIITDISMVIEGAESTITAIQKNGVIFVPFEATAKAFWMGYSFKDGTHTATASRRSLSIDAENNVQILGHTVTPEVAPELYNDILYLPAELLAKAFNLDIIIAEGVDKPVLHIATSPNDNYELNSLYISNSNLASDTYYLIWVSKSEYKVRVFLGGKGNWNQINSFTCAIGAPGTPTCEGTFKYFQAQDMWDYGSYYVGPIMRFYRGFALHSTLIYKDGTPKDDRVGMRLSLGCVRLHPEDINWLAYYAPVGTTVHVTP